MNTKAQKHIILQFIPRLCISACLTFSLNACQMGESASSDVSAIKIVFEKDAEKALQQKMNIEISLQMSFANNPSKYNKLINTYNELNENTNIVLDLIEHQRDNLKAGNNVDTNSLLNSIGDLQKKIEDIYALTIQETYSFIDLEKERVNTDIVNVFTISFFSHFDKSSNEVKDLLLAKLANDIINTEIKVANSIYNAYENSGCINAIIVVPNKSEYKVGENYEANIYLATKDTTKPAEITANGFPVKDGHLVIPCTKAGENIVEGAYTIKKDDGTRVQYDFQSKYKVTK